MRPNTKVTRRSFIKSTGGAAAVAALAVPSLPGATKLESDPRRIQISGPNSLFHGFGWESLNPGYWQVKDGALRRRFHNYGDRARSTGFPFHYETHRRNGGKMNVDYDPSLPFGTLFRREWKLQGEWSVSGSFTYRGTADVRRDGDSADWDMYRPAYGLMGLAFGSKNLFESYDRGRNVIVAGWTADGAFGISGKGKNDTKSVSAPTLKPGDVVTISVSAKPAGERTLVTAVFAGPDGQSRSVSRQVAKRQADGYIGVAARGLADFELNELRIEPGDNRPVESREIECHTCYPLGDSLKETDGGWTVRFVGIFASDGSEAQIRVADSPHPAEGWERVPSAGAGRIVNNRWRRNTATIHVTLPENPADKTLYYTVWKDGRNVTADPRIGSGATGPGTGMVGDVPASGDYVGRLPQLRAPYKICGLSCHAINSGLQQRTKNGWRILGGGDDWQIRDQPTVEAYRHLEDYDFQVMCWEDDVWYMELVLYPPSTDDAYKVVTTSICGPTSRWQMMRHWNVINPGDHDYGMDDVKGPEQIVIRLRDGLGQDRDYMRRNFQIVHHLITGDEEADPLANPKHWRAWKMPNRDFTFAIVDSRLWRSSQDTAMWDDEGWGHLRELYDRADPTRSLLGEEQFAWLQQLIRTDSSRLICLTGLNGMHTVWTGGQKYSHTDNDFDQRDRVAADYAGWVAAGADRVIELLGSRDGVVTVYGDVHNGSILRNTDHGLIECSFGPIGRSGGRAVIKGFGPKMKDFDGRPLDVTALYHKEHANPDLEAHGADEPFYWNFLEMEFDPGKNDPAIGLRIRNLIDEPAVAPRGGAPLETVSSATGRAGGSRLPAMGTLPNADVRVVSTEGSPLRGTRSGGDGQMPATRLVGIPVGTRVIVTAYDGRASRSEVVTTVA